MTDRRPALQLEIGHRRRYPIELKVQIVLEMLKEEQSVTQLAWLNKKSGMA